jgi:hypothetical protein
MPQEHLLALTYAPLGVIVNEEEQLPEGSWDILLSRICDDISSNLESSCSNRLSTYIYPEKSIDKNVKVNDTLTNAVSSCGLEISLATIVDGFVCLVDGVEVLSLSFSPLLDGVGTTFNGKANEGIGLDESGSSDGVSISRNPNKPK